MTTITLSTEQYFKEADELMKKDLQNSIDFALPKIAKVVINTGVGKFEKTQREEIVDLIEKLTGQIPKQIKSRESISAFKLRAGELNGVSVTLRGQRALDFIFLMVYIALPRTKDFRGIKATSWNHDKSTYSLGISDSSIFPQIGFNTKVAFGMQINIVFKQPSDNNLKYLEALKFPFKK